jgi:integrase
MSVAPKSHTGIHRHASGWRAVVSRGRGLAPIKRFFPGATPVATMQAWREDERAKLRLRRKARAISGTFEADATKYLRAVTSMTTYKTRKKDIELWIEIFGRTMREDITAADIRAVRERWIADPRGVDDDGKPLPAYAASTINHRLRALSNLWTVLDGRRAPNPVREVPEVQEPDALPRAIDYAIIEQVLEALPDRGQPPPRAPGTAKAKRPTVSKSKARLRVLAYTGLTYAQLGRMQPSDVDLDGAAMLVRRRAKGKGAKPNKLPLMPKAVEAFRALAAADAWGPFSSASIRKSFLRACARVRKTGVALGHVRPYDLRHSLGTLVTRATGSTKTAQLLLQHTTDETTLRYALDAVDEALQSQMAKVTARFDSDAAARGQHSGTTGEGDSRELAGIGGSGSRPEPAKRPVRAPRKTSK